MSPSVFRIRMVFFFRADLFQFCGNSFSEIKYNEEERNSPDSSRTSNYIRLPRLALFEVEEFTYHQLYKVHKHHNKRIIYREYRTSYRDFYSRKNSRLWVDENIKFNKS